MNTKAYDKMNYALCLLSSSMDGKRHGCIINSFHQITSSKPAKFTIAVNRDNETYKAIESSGSFCVSMLSLDCPDDIINTFGYKSGRVGDKFAAFEAKTDESGNPYIEQGAVARVTCKVSDKMEVGNYVVYVGEATEAEVLDEAAVLTLDDFTNRGKAVPPTATVYRTVSINAYRCTICGYVYEGESLPAAYRCPICGASADKFEKVIPGN